MGYLRRWERTDAPALARAIDNRAIMDNLRDGLPYPYTVADAEQYIEYALTQMQHCLWAIVVDGVAVGSLGIHRKDNIHCRTAELGYYLAEPLWGRGIMTAAVREACGHVFESTDIVRIFAEPFAQNTASCRVLEKAGFVREGVLRKNAQKNGKIIDMVMYALVKEG